jgi:hypothetical protein
VTVLRVDVRRRKSLLGSGRAVRYGKRESVLLIRADCRRHVTCRRGASVEVHAIRHARVQATCRVDHQTAPNCVSAERHHDVAREVLRGRIRGNLHLIEDSRAHACGRVTSLRPGNQRGRPSVDHDGAESHGSASPIGQPKDQEVPRSARAEVHVLERERRGRDGKYRTVRQDSVPLDDRRSSPAQSRSSLAEAQGWSDS